MAFERVSGSGRIYSYTETVTGARHPHFAQKGPYLVGTVELDEQAGLFMVTNFHGVQLRDLRIGARVEVTFDPGQAVVLPQFQLVHISGAEAV